MLEWVCVGEKMITLHARNWHWGGCMTVWHTACAICTDPAKSSSLSLLLYWHVFSFNIKTFIVQYGDSWWVLITKMMLITISDIVYAFHTKCIRFGSLTTKQQMCILFNNVLERNNYYRTLITKISIALWSNISHSFSNLRQLCKVLLIIIRPTWPTLQDPRTLKHIWPLLPLCVMIFEKKHNQASERYISLY